MAGDVGGRECEVCASPHVNSVNYELMQGGTSQNKIAAKYGFSRHSINRHQRNGHIQKRTDALAKAPESSPALEHAQKDMANTIASIAARAENIMAECERQYDRVKDGNNVKDIAELLKLNLSALRELGNLAGAYPKPSATTVDARSIHLNGLSQDDLKALIAGLRGFNEPQ